MVAFRLSVIPVALVVAALVVIVASGGSSAGQVVDHDYVGAERCKSCHAAEFAAWEASPHARALQSLSTTERSDPRCLACHTMVPEDTQVALAGVQCESCHGAGRHYSQPWVMRDAELRKQLNLVVKIDGATCVRCHTDATPSLVPFDFATKRELIKHWSK